MENLKIFTARHLNVPHYNLTIKVSLIFKDEYFESFTIYVIAMHY